MPLMRWSHWVLAWSCLCSFAACAGPRDSAPLNVVAPPIAAPLVVDPGNPRYFTDGHGKIVYLVGSHTWRNFLDPISGPRPGRFDYPAYLEFLQRHHLNFIRLWRPEEATYEPTPYLRTGPGSAMDGRPKFDLDRFNPEFFERLAARVEEAGRRGIYVAVMLFQGWSVERKAAERPDDPWPLHPFHRANNINGIDGDHDGNGDGAETHTLLDPAVTAYQERFVRRVIETVTRFDNVLYEIANESAPDSFAWQEHLVRLIHDEEARKPKRHLVWYTAHSDSRDEDLWSSSAEVVSPAVAPPFPPDYIYIKDPPPGDGRKVVITDTDHLWGIGGTADWVWKSFTRGLHPIYMDPYDPAVDPDDYDRVRAGRDGVLAALGQTRRDAERLPLRDMTPRGELCSSRYCLVAPGRAYLIYAPAADEAQVAHIALDLQHHAGDYLVEWRDLRRDHVHRLRQRLPAGRSTLIAPFNGPAVLYVTADDR